LTGEADPVVEAGLAAIPGASSPAKSATRWSKRQARDTDEHSLKRTSKLKAQGNEGDKNPDPLSFNLTDLCIQENLSSVGIMLGQDHCSIYASLGILRESVSVSAELAACDKKYAS
jgi:hypothetical protein